MTSEEWLQEAQLARDLESLGEGDRLVDLTLVLMGLPVIIAEGVVGRAINWMNRSGRGPSSVTAT